MMSALYAQKSLNGHYLKDINIRLFVNWCNPLEEKSLAKDEIKLLQMNNQKNSVEILNAWNKETDITPKNPKPLPNLPLNISVQLFLNELLKIRHFLMFL